MKAIKFLVFLFTAAFLITSCNKVTYRKTAGGLPYKLYEGKSGSRKIQVGNFIKLSLTQEIKDSVSFTTADKMPLYLRVMETSTPYDITELWSKLHKGDSVVATQLIDTFIKRSPANVPPQYKNGDQIKYYIKILDVFTSDSAAQADENNTKSNILKEEIAAVESYLKSKNISAQKTPSGAFIHITDPGTGNAIDSGKYVSLRYKGTSFSGKVFDANIDTTAGDKPLLSFTIGTGRMIRGFEEGVKFLKYGGTGTIYVPSLLAYGAAPGTELIKPFESIYFEVKVIDVKDKEPAQPQGLQGQPQQAPAGH